MLWPLALHKSQRLGPRRSITLQLNPYVLVRKTWQCMQLNRLCGIVSHLLQLLEEELRPNLTSKLVKTSAEAATGAVIYIRYGSWVESPHHDIEVVLATLEVQARDAIRLAQCLVHAPFVRWCATVASFACAVLKFQRYLPLPQQVPT